MSVVTWIALAIVGAAAVRFYAPADPALRNVGLALALVGTGLFIFVSALFFVLWSGGKGWASLFIIVGLASFLLGAYTFHPGQRGRPYTFEDVSVTLTVENREGTEAHFEQRESLRIERSGLSVFWQKGFGVGVGSIRNFRVEYLGLPVEKQSIESAGEGLYNIMTVLDAAPKKGSAITRLLEFDWSGPSSNEDGHRFSVNAVTQSLEIKLAMPEGRACTSVAVEVNGKAVSGEPQPQVMETGREVIWRKRDPEVGKSYTVLCRHST